MAVVDRTLASACTQLEETSFAVSESIRDFFLYYPAARQDVATLSPELAEVRLAAQLLRSNSQSVDANTSPVPGGLISSVKAIVQASIDLANEIGEAVDRPDQNAPDRDTRLQHITDNLRALSERLANMRTALNLALDTVLLALNQGQGNTNTGEASSRPPPYPGTESNHPELPPYQSSQIFQEVVNLRARIGNADDDPLAGRQRPALAEFLDTVRQYVESTSQNLAVPVIEFSGSSAASDAVSVLSRHSRITSTIIQVAHPAPSHVSLRHIRKLDVAVEEVLEIVGLRRKGAYVFATTWFGQTRMYDCSGTACFNVSYMAFDMKFSQDESSWVYTSSAVYNNDVKRKMRLDIKAYITKKGVAAIGSHLTGYKSAEVKAVRPLAISPNGSVIALLGRGDKIFLVNPKGGLIRTIHVHVDEIVNAIFTPNGELLISASKDGTILLTEVATGETLAKQDCDTHKKLFFLGITPDGEIIVSVWGDTVMRWQWALGDLESYNLSAKRGREGRPIAMSDDCRFIACTNHEGLDISDVHSGQLLHRVRFQSGHITAAAFAPDGSHLALGKTTGITAHTTSKATLDIWQLVF
ncbi:hypothetical protein B0I35DRAFT_476919 [Stachybotrys elegans]|uniref:NACHT-NTPase and P-loop NTPases N-terminal domain-containing protein n=1 Tax=Stachybotrys elegans TaxID=80388 RepID=A0A8K0T1I2_9HYPO|nr:hypothetical protein B0I35DRAFT_476919 [Stachybotrys elegans]